VRIDFYNLHCYSLTCDVSVLWPGNLNNLLFNFDLGVGFFGTLTNDFCELTELSAFIMMFSDTHKWLIHLI